MEGKLIIFSAPSGAGKTTIVRHLLKVFPQLEFSISACSRDKRGQEVDGKDYYYLSVDEFKSKIEGNAFAEWEEVYAGNYYGTLKSELKRIWDKGNAITFDIDVIGGINLKKRYGDRALAVFVMPPSIDALEKRLYSRESDTPETIAKRIAKAEEEISHAKSFDTIILNDNLEDTFKEAEALVKSFLGI